MAARRQDSNEFEQGGVNDQGASSTLTSRNSFVGISDDRFGQVLVGNYDSVYRSLVGSGSELGGNLGMSSHGLDLWNNTSAQMSGNANSVFSRGEARLKNSVHYLSPTWAGVQFGGSYGFRRACARRSPTAPTMIATPQAAKYANGPLVDRRGLRPYPAEHGRRLSTPAPGRLRASRSDGQNQRVHTTYAEGRRSQYKPCPRTPTWARASSAPATATPKCVPPAAGSIYSTTQKGQMGQNDFMVSVAQDVTDKAALLFSYGRLGSLGNAVFGTGNEYGANQYSVGAQYSFNSHLATYVTVTRINNKAQQSVNLGESPLYSNDVGFRRRLPGPGRQPCAFGIGLIARF